MSIINQMLRDLEKRRPQSATVSPQGIAGNVLPAPVMTITKHRSLHTALWALSLLAIGLSAGVMILRPATLDGMMSMTSLASMMPGASATPHQPIPASPVTSDHSRSNSEPLSLVTPAPALVANDNNVTALSVPQPTTVTPALQPSSAPTPKSVATLNTASLQSSTLEQEPQPVTPAPQVPLPANQANVARQETADATIPSKHIKEITPPQQAENEYRKAVELLQQGQMTRTMEGLAQALQLDASHVAARQTLVGLLVEAKRFNEAEQRLQEGLKVDVEANANRPALAMMLARLQVERSDARAGLDTLQRTLPDIPENAVEYANYQAFLAALLQRDGQHADAIEHYLQALRKTPQSGVWLIGIGISLQAENRLQDAQEAFQRATTSNTLSPELLAFVEQRLKQIKR